MLRNMTSSMLNKLYQWTSVKLECACNEIRTCRGVCLCHRLKGEELLDERGCLWPRSNSTNISSSWRLGKHKFSTRWTPFLRRYEGGWGWWLAGKAAWSAPLPMPGRELINNTGITHRTSDPHASQLPAVLLIQTIINFHLPLCIS